MTGSRSQPNEDAPTPAPAPGSDAEAGREIRRPGLAAAGIACLSIIVGGAWFAVLFSMSLTREIGVDSQGIGLDDVIGSAILSLPGFGLAILAVWFLRRSGLGRAAGWACLVTAVLVVVIGIAGIVMALVEFADTEGTSPVLASRAGTVYGVLIAIYLAVAGSRLSASRRAR